MLETVKVALAGGVTISSAKQVKIPIALGDLEVALLHKIRVVCDQSQSASAWVMNWALWRKSDADYTAGKEIRVINVAEHGDFIAAGSIMNQYNLQGAAGLAQGRYNLSDDFTFPKPMVVIRPPQILVKTAGTSGFIFGVLLYYTTLEVSKDELARLMVKDHA